jgi:hypothetical protein
MVQAYWEVGRLIVENEQKGISRAEYGKAVLEKLSARLTNVFGEGFSVQSLRNFRQFYQTFPIRSTLWSESENKKHSTMWSVLTWSHFKLLIRVKEKEEIV